MVSSRKRNYVFMALRRYQDFSGRSGRREYWSNFLFTLALGAAFVLIDELLGTRRGILGFFSGLFFLVFLIPSMAVCVRRLHDTDKSAWWLLILLIPVVGTIFILLFLLEEGMGTHHEKYGPNPRLVDPEI